MEEETFTPTEHAVGDKITIAAQDKEIEQLREENELLRMDKESAQRYIIETFYKLTNNSGGKRQVRSKLSDRMLEQLSNSIEPFGSHHLRNMNREDLMIILLYREANLYRIVNEYEESLKNNDRLIFNNQKREIERLSRLLYNKEPLIKENEKLREEIEMLKEKNHSKMLTNRALIGDIRALNNKLKIMYDKEEINDNIDKELKSWSTLNNFDHIHVLREFGENLMGRFKK